ncbi:biotin--[acetyl-CoA-carboxylase] ligase [Flavobacterium sp. U410]
MNIIKLNATASTNTFLKELIIETNLENLTVVTTRNQFQGKGQRGNGWQAEEGKNLTFSVFLKDFISRYNDLFLLNIIVPLCILKALKKMTVSDVSIKWPNDILSGNKKVAGILVENLFKGNGEVYSIIGVGLNVNQEKFENLPQASSLKNVTGQEFVIEDVLDAILKEMTVFFSEDCSVDEEEIWNEYHKFLFRKGIPTVFETPNQRKFMGIILEVNREGKLCIQLEDDSIRTFDLKEVKMYY